MHAYNPTAVCPFLTPVRALPTALDRLRDQAPAPQGLFFPRTDGDRRPALVCLLLAALAFSAANHASAQGPCVEAPLFSGNVVVPMPPRPENLSEALQAESRAIGDFNTDDRLDLVFGTNYGSLVYFRGRPDWWEFETPVVIPLPFTPPPPGMLWSISALAAADFNADGKLDLAIGDAPPPPGVFVPPTPERIHVMLGNGDGTFQPASAWGPDPKAVVKFSVADFNNDGHLDLGYGTDGGAAVPDTVGILWGTGTGSFPTYTIVYTGLIPFPGAGWIDAADIDTDFDVDAVVVCPTVPAAILRNNGNGTFATEPLVMPVVTGFQFGYTFGELSGDGFPDIVFATNRDPILAPLDEAIYVRLNDGTGHFPGWARYSVSTHPDQTFTCSNPLPADLNGDGRDEVVVGRGSICSATEFNDQVLVFRNAGDGTLEEPPALFHRVGGLAQTPMLAAADLDDDGRTDVVAGDEHITTLLLSDGDGGFLTAHGAPMGPSVQGLCGNGAITDIRFLTSGDVNGDGRFDLVGVREGINGVPQFLECTIMLQDAQGAFTTLSSVPLPERQTTGLVLADFDQDDKLDMAVSTASFTALCAGDAVRVALGNGNGTFGAWATYHTVGKGSTHLAAGDLNGDLWPDLVVTEWSGASCPLNPQEPRGVSVLLNNGASGGGTFAPPVQYDLGAQCEHVVIADLNGDQDLDIAVVWGPPLGPSGVRVLLNNGNGTFTPTPDPNNYTPAGTLRITFADGDADGDLDMFITPHYLAFLPPPGGLVVALNDGDGTFTYLGIFYTDTDFGPIAFADLDSDQRLDLIGADEGSGFHSGTINIYRGNGDCTFTPPVAYGGGGPGLIVEDFDNDGRPDLGSPLGCSPDSDLNTHLGFAILLNRTCPACYPDCNESGSLTVADFTCFQTRFVAGDPYADCNQTGTLTVADFTCFQTKFVVGCP